MYVMHMLWNFYELLGLKIIMYLRIFYYLIQQSEKHIQQGLNAAYQQNRGTTGLKYSRHYSLCIDICWFYVPIYQYRTYKLEVEKIRLIQ